MNGAAKCASERVNDLIAAVATPPGRGAVAMIRLSGPGAVAALASVWRGRPLESLPDGRQTFGRIVERRASGVSGPDAEEMVDEVTVLVRRAPRSFTGEETAEIICHGGVLVTRRILDLLLAAGARLAGPGEFTRRAFENGKLDLAEAEAVIDLINAGTDLARRAAAAQLSGRLSGEIARLREDLIWALAQTEAAIDFPEEGIDAGTGAALDERIASCQRRIRTLLESEQRGRVLREGFRVAIIGPPNAGKSSLLNALLGHDRAIVSPEAGTTRDFIEETLDLGGVPVRLADTAGLREGAGEIEREGMDRSLRLAAVADLVIELHDGSLPPPARVLSGEIPPERRMLVLNKSDLDPDPGWAGREAVRVSCLTGAGLDELAALIARRALGDARADDPLLAVGARHAHALRKALAHLDRARAELRAGELPEIVALDLRAGLAAAGDVVGETDVEEILGNIFSRFCIGK